MKTRESGPARQRRRGSVQLPGPPWGPRPAGYRAGSHTARRQEQAGNQPVIGNHHLEPILGVVQPGECLERHLARPPAATGWDDDQGEQWRNSSTQDLRGAYPRGYRRMSRSAREAPARGTARNLLARGSRALAPFTDSLADVQTFQVPVNEHVFRRQRSRSTTCPFEAMLRRSSVACARHSLDVGPAALQLWGRLGTVWSSAGRGPRPHCGLSAGGRAA